MRSNSDSVAWLQRKEPFREAASKTAESLVKIDGY